jgi:hypothetical protein
MSKLTLTSVLVAGRIAMMTPAPLGATTYDHLAYLTFSGRVQVPGVTLDAGTYRFRLANPDSGRKVLQVLSENGSEVYAMFQTRPDSRSKATDAATVTFIETPSGVPPAVRSLFYGGQLDGYEFVYPRGGPIMVAEFVPQPEITYSSSPPPTFPDARIIPAPAAVPEPAAVAEPVPPPAEEPIAPPVEIAQTATPVPLVAIGGFVTLLAAFGVGLLRKAFS